MEKIPQGKQPVAVATLAKLTGATDETLATPHIQTTTTLLVSYSGVVLHR